MQKRKLKWVWKACTALGFLLTQVSFGQAQAHDSCLPDMVEAGSLSKVQSFSGKWTFKNGLAIGGLFSRLMQVSRMDPYEVKKLGQSKTKTQTIIRGLQKTASFLRRLQQATPQDKTEGINSLLWEGAHVALTGFMLYQEWDSQRENLDAAHASIMNYLADQGIHLQESLLGSEEEGYGRWSAGYLIGLSAGTCLWAAADRLVDHKYFLTSSLAFASSLETINPNSYLMALLEQKTNLPFTALETPVQTLVSVGVLAPTLKTAQWIYKALKQNPMHLHVLLHAPELMQLPQDISRRFQQAQDPVTFGMTFGAYAPYFVHAAQHLSLDQGTSDAAFEGAHLFMALHSIDEVLYEPTYTAMDFITPALEYTGLPQAARASGTLLGDRVDKVANWFGYELDSKRAFQAFFGTTLGAGLSQVTLMAGQKALTNPKVWSALEASGPYAPYVYAMAMAAYQENMGQRDWTSGKTWVDFGLAFPQHLIGAYILRSAAYFLKKEPLDLHAVLDMTVLSNQALKALKDKLSDRLLPPAKN